MSLGKEAHLSAKAELTCGPQNVRKDSEFCSELWRTWNGVTVFNIGHDKPFPHNKHWLLSYHTFILSNTSFSSADWLWEQENNFLSKQNHWKQIDMWQNVNKWLHQWAPSTVVCLRRVNEHRRELRSLNVLLTVVSNLMNDCEDRQQSDGDTCVLTWTWFTMASVVSDQ